MPVVSVDMKSVPDIIEAQLTFSYSRLSEILRIIVDQGNSHDEELGQLRRRIEALERDNAGLHEQLQARQEFEKAREEKDSSTDQVMNSLRKEMEKLQASLGQNRAEQDKQIREQRMQRDEALASENAYKMNLENQLRKVQEEIKMLSSTAAVLYAFYSLWGVDDMAVMSMGARHGTMAERGSESKIAVLSSNLLGRSGVRSISPMDKGGASTFASPSGSSQMASEAVEAPLTLSSGVVLSGDSGFRKVKDQSGRNSDGSMIRGGKAGAASTVSLRSSFSTPGILRHENGTPIALGGIFEHSLEARTDFLHHLSAFSSVMDSLEKQRVLQLQSLQQANNSMPAPLNSQPHQQGGLRRKTSSMANGCASDESSEPNAGKGIVDPALEERVEHLEAAVKELSEEVNEAILLAGHLANLEEMVDGIQAHQATIPPDFFSRSRGGAEIGGRSGGSPFAISQMELRKLYSKSTPRASLQDGSSSRTSGSGDATANSRGEGQTTSMKFTPSSLSADGSKRTGSVSNSGLPPISFQKQGSEGGGGFTSGTPSGTGGGRSPVNGGGGLHFPPFGVVSTGSSLAKSQSLHPSYPGGVDQTKQAPDGGVSIHSSVSGIRGSSNAGGELLYREGRSASLVPSRYLFPPTRLSINVVTTEQPHVEMLRVHEATAAVAAQEEGLRYPSHSAKRSEDVMTGSSTSAHSNFTPKVVIPFPEEGLRRRLEAMEENVAMLEFKKADRNEVAILEEALRQLLIQTALARGASVSVDMKYPPMPALGAIQAGRPLYVTASGSIPLRDGEKKTNATVSAVGYEMGKIQGMEKK